MSDDRPEPESHDGDVAKHPGPAKDAGKNSALERRKQALRENLKRRRAQARGRGETAASSQAEPASPHHGSRNRQDD